MKLVKKIYTQSVLWLFPIAIIGGIFCFYMIKYVSYEETDEYLSYEMERLVRFHDQNNDLPDFHKITRIDEVEKNGTTFFKDTLIFEPADQEMIPHRELHFFINHETRHYEIVLSHILPGNDDIAEGAFWIILALMLLLFGSVSIVISHTSKRIWMPFYKTLNKLENFRLENSLEKFEKTNIDEFQELNNIIEHLLSKIITDYLRTKEFNENASHEFQTQLAIIRSKLEILTNELPESSELHSQVQKAYKAANHLSQVQKSLLLLSKIGNREFSSNTEFDLKDVISKSLDLFSEAIEMRNIKLTTSLNNQNVIMDPGLSDILINNLIKNSIKHNISNGFINIELNDGKLSIENSGKDEPLAPEKLLERFAKGNQGEWGIGLAIVKQICDIYQFQLSYSIKNNNHLITISFPPKNLQNQY